jgi:hypothetical protein
MVIDDFDVKRLGVIVGPLKADAPLIVYADAVLPLTVAAQGLKTIAGQLHQTLTRNRILQDQKTFFRLFLKSLKRLNPLARNKSCRALIPTRDWFWFMFRHMINMAKKDAIRQASSFS